jgi:hypothetical protein
MAGNGGEGFRLLACHDLEYLTAIKDSFEAIKSTMRPLQGISRCF